MSLLEDAFGRINASREFKVVIKVIESNAGNGLIPGVEIGNKGDAARTFEPDILLALGLGDFFYFNAVDLIGLADGKRHHNLG